MSNVPITKLVHESGAGARFGTDPKSDVDRPLGVAPHIAPRITEHNDDEIDRERADDDGMALASPLRP